MYKLSQSIKCINLKAGVWDKIVDECTTEVQILTRNLTIKKLYCHMVRVKGPFHRMTQK